MHAERGGERASGPPSLRQHLRHGRHVTDQPPDPGEGPSPLLSRRRVCSISGATRPGWTTPPTKLAACFPRSAKAHFAPRLSSTSCAGSTPSSSPTCPTPSPRSAARRRGPRRVLGAPGPTGGRDGAAGGGGRLRLRRGGAGPNGRRHQCPAHRERAVVGGFVVAEHRPTDRLDRVGLPRAARWCLIGRLTEVPTPVNDLLQRERRPDWPPRAPLPRDRRDPDPAPGPGPAPADRRVDTPNRPTTTAPRVSSVAHQGKGGR